MALKEDNILLLAISRGSMKAFDFLYRKYALKVERFASALLVNSGFTQADVDDLVQEIFLKIWLKRETLAGTVDNFNAYLFRMTKNAVLNMLSRHNEQNEKIDRMLDLASDDDIIGNAISDEVQSNINRLIESMPEARQKVFYMSREEGMSNKEIAQKLKISDKTVEYHIGRALSDIRKNLS